MTKDEFEDKAFRYGLCQYFDLEGDSVGIAMILDMINEAVEKEKKRCINLCIEKAMDYREMKWMPEYDVCTYLAHLIGSKDD